jgi:hypothetical protein
VLTHCSDIGKQEALVRIVSKVEQELTVRDRKISPLSTNALRERQQLDDGQWSHSAVE